MNALYSNRIQDKENGVRPLSTALKTLAVVDLLAASPRAMKLSEIAAAMTLTRATAYQRLLTLVEAGWVEQDDAYGYRLSMHSVHVAAAAMEQADLGARVNPILVHLVGEARETASLAVLDRGRPCIVARVESDSVLRAEQKVGTFLSLDGSASGRVLVAFADEETRRRLASNADRMPDDDLLAKVRETGYAVSNGQAERGVKAIAAPVFDANMHCAAALSLVLPESRFELENLKDPLLKAAASVTQLLQGNTKSNDTF